MENSYDHESAEKRIIEFWEQSSIFAFDEKSSKQVFSIDTPPPTVSGELHMGHMFSYSHADFIARYKRMRGFNVFYPFGLDNNGLPTELLMEKKFNTTAEALGREKFVKLVSDNIGAYVDNYTALFKRMGLSVDWNRRYETISSEVQKISQLSFLKLAGMGRVYRSEEPVLYCPKCKTVVSQMELEDKTLESNIYTVSFGGVDIATTRPELLPACVAVLVNPADARYKSLIGKKVKVPLVDSEVAVIADDGVDKDFGTGAVMCCTFGDATDVEWYKKYHLDLKIIIDENGRMTNGQFKGMTIKEARAKIVEALKSRGLVKSESSITHSVNTHERCGTEIEFLVKKQWKIKYLDLKEKFIEMGRQVKWHPEFMRVRYENWVNGLKWDWNISRQRMFGVKFPVWYCKKCGKPKFANEKDLPVDPFTESPKEPCECGSTEFEPETDIMDTWATSSLTPLINAHWGSDSSIMDRIFPMSLRPQAHEIISFWTFTTIVKSYFHTGSIPWRDIMLSGHGLDQHGRPIHKSWGNVIVPAPYIEKYGADALRYWASTAMLGDDISFQEKELIAAIRLEKKLWNVGRFIEMHLPAKSGIPELKHTDVMELAKLSKVIREVTESFENFDYFKARMRTEEFFWEFANDYLEIAKGRIYDGEASSIYTTAKAFLAVLKMLAPIMPFVTEEIYQKLFVANRDALGAIEDIRQSIHLSGWPEPGELNESYIESMNSLLEVVHCARKWKHEHGMPLNAELSKITVNEKYRGSIAGSEDDIKNTVKTHQLDFSRIEEACNIEA
ncbi:MAG: valine--tRNA ligase [Candidatus Micrarchaeia archaeon]